jgi:hypothetical protein
LKAVRRHAEIDGVQARKIIEIRKTGPDIGWPD